MFNFLNDYSTGAHPLVLDALLVTNTIPTEGYGMDEYSELAAYKIRDIAGAHDSEVHFLVGGTQANAMLISQALRPHEAAIAADTGHINTHETGAVEFTGHKIITVPGADGKIAPAQIEAVLASHEDEHMVKPRLVYISNSTELGTVYTEDELAAISEVCKKLDLYLFVDGARLAVAIDALGADIRALAKYADAFYIGGTKNGALMGEAMVVVNPALAPGFRYHMKQVGGMLAKGRLLGVQFNALFTNDLYYRIGAHSNRMARLLERAFTDNGFEFAVKPVTNQLFPIMDEQTIERLSGRAAFSKWSSLGDGRSVVRFVTSWSTTEEEIEGFAEIL